MIRIRHSAREPDDKDQTDLFQRGNQMIRIRHSAREPDDKDQTFCEGTR